MTVVDIDDTTSVLRAKREALLDQLDAVDGALAARTAAGITDAVVKAIDKGDFDAIIMNYANADMVGHSGKLEAAIKAVETVDECLGRLYQSLKPGGLLARSRRVTGFSRRR